MRRASLVVFVALAPAWGQIKPAAASLPASVITTDKQRVPWAVITDLEKELDNRISRANAKDPMMLLGNTSGIYIGGYGTVFTVQVDLINTPGISPFKPKYSREELAEFRERKIAHLPLLKQTMRDMWLASARGLVSMPENQQVVVAVRLLYLPWEDSFGLPGQIVVRAERRALQTGEITMEEQ